MHHRLETIVRAGVAGAMVALAIAGCGPVYRPTVVGVVASRELVGHDLKYVFTDGRTFSIPLETRTLGSQPDAGDLLLSGTEPEPWLLKAEPGAAPGDPPVCFRIWSRARADSRSVYLRIDDAKGAVEVAVPKADTFEEFGKGRGSESLGGTTTCLNERGEATLRFSLEW